MLEGRRFWFVGIGGAGMSALALVAKEWGAEVGGSDRARSSYVERLEAAGVPVVIGHEAANVPDRAEVIVLGCAGMADLAARLSESHGLPVIDGVASAVKLAEAFGALGLKTSKIGAYAPPRPKPYLGSFAPFEPR